MAAAFLAGYGDATRAAYGRDLRAWGAFLAAHGVAPFDARRVHVDAFCREAEAAGVAPSTLARRLTAMAGFYAYAGDEGLTARNPVARVRRPRVSDESPPLGLDRSEIRVREEQIKLDGLIGGSGCVRATGTRRRRPPHERGGRGVVAGIGRARG